MFVSLELDSLDAWGNTMDTAIDLVDFALTACTADLGSPGEWVAPACLRNSLALVLIESIQAPRSHYTSVRNVLDRYREFRAEAGAEAAEDGTSALLATFEALGGPESWAERIGNRKPVSTRAGAPRKAAVIREAAGLLAGMGVDTAAQLRGLDAEAFHRLRVRWVALPGQSSGLTWRYLAVHTGITPVAADPVVTGYFGGDGAEILLNATAQRLGVTAEQLAYAIWRHQTGRPVVEAPPFAMQRE